MAPYDRNKTLTALAGAEPAVQAHSAPVQQMQFFLAESNWDVKTIAERTLQLRLADPLIAAMSDGVLVIDENGDRKDGCFTDHVARQYLGSVGKIDNGIVAVITLRADEQRYYPQHVVPYTPECRLPGGKQDPAFHTKPQLALDLVDIAYGDNRPFVRELNARQRPYVLAHSGKVGRGWAPAHVAHRFEDAARELLLRAWQRMVRRFRDGHTQRWWAAELTLFRYGPYATKPKHLVSHHNALSGAGATGRSRSSVRIA